MNEYESFAVGFDYRVMNEVGIVDGLTPAEGSVVAL